MIEQLNYPVRVEVEELDKSDVDARFENMIHLIDLNDQLEDTGLRADEKAQLTGDRDALLGDLLANPTDLFVDEFKWLQGMYENRTMTDTDMLGTTMSQFVTRDPSRRQADLHFRELQYSSGRSERIVEVPQRGSDALPYFISVSDGQLRIAASVYERGMIQRKELEPTSDSGLRLLKEFFTHSGMARDLVDIIRTEDGNRQADEQARRFLLAKIIAQRTLA